MKLLTRKHKDGRRELCTVPNWKVKFYLQDGWEIAGNPTFSESEVRGLTLASTEYALRCPWTQHQNFSFIQTPENQHNMDIKSYIGIYKNKDHLTGKNTALITYLSDREVMNMGGSDLKPTLLIAIENCAENVQRLWLVSHRIANGQLEDNPSVWDDQATDKMVQHFCSDMANHTVVSRQTLLTALSDAKQRELHKQRLKDLTADFRGSRVTQHIDFQTVEAKVAVELMGVKTKAIAGMEFKSTENEVVRVYTMSNGKALTIDKPRWVHVAESGSHRVVNEAGRSFYVPRACDGKQGWVYFGFLVAEGTPAWRW